MTASSKRERNTSLARASLQKEIEKNDALICEKAWCETVELGIVAAVFDEEIKHLLFRDPHLGDSAVPLAEDIKDQADALQLLNQAAAKRELQRCMYSCSTAVGDVDGAARKTAKCAKRVASASSLGECKPRQAAVIRRFLRPRLRQVCEDIGHREHTKFVGKTREVEQLQCKVLADAKLAMDAVTQHESVAKAARHDLATHLQATEGQFNSLKRQLREDLQVQTQLQAQLLQQREVARSRARADRLAFRDLEAFTVLLWHFHFWVRHVSRANTAKCELHARQCVKTMEQRSNALVEQMGQLEHQRQDLAARFKLRQELCARLGRERLQQALRGQLDYGWRLCKLVLDPWRQCAVMLRRGTDAAELARQRARCDLAEYRFRSTSVQLESILLLSSEDARLAQQRHCLSSWRASCSLARSQKAEKKWQSLVGSCGDLRTRRFELLFAFDTWRLSGIVRLLENQLSGTKAELDRAAAHGTRCQGMMLMEFKERGRQWTRSILFVWWALATNHWRRTAVALRRGLCERCTCLSERVCRSARVKFVRMCLAVWHSLSRHTRASARKIARRVSDAGSCYALSSFCRWAWIAGKTRTARRGRSVATRMVSSSRRSSAACVFRGWRLWIHTVQKRRKLRLVWTAFVQHDLHLHMAVSFTIWRNMRQQHEERLRLQHTAYASRAQSCVCTLAAVLQRQRIFNAWREAHALLQRERVAATVAQEHLASDGRKRLSHLQGLCDSICIMEARYDARLIAASVRGWQWQCQQAVHRLELQRQREGQNASLHLVQARLCSVATSMAAREHAFIARAALCAWSDHVRSSTLERDLDAHRGRVRRLQASRCSVLSRSSKDIAWFCIGKIVFAWAALSLHCRSHRAQAALRLGFGRRRDTLLERAGSSMVAQAAYMCLHMWRLWHRGRLTTARSVEILAHRTLDQLSCATLCCFSRWASAAAKTTGVRRARQIRIRVLSSIDAVIAKLLMAGSSPACVFNGWQSLVQLSQRRRLGRRIWTASSANEFYLQVAMVFRLWRHVRRRHEERLREDYTAYAARAKRYIGSSSSAMELQRVFSAWCTEHAHLQRARALLAIERERLCVDENNRLTRMQVLDKGICIAEARHTWQFTAALLIAWHLQCRSIVHKIERDNLEEDLSAFRIRLRERTCFIASSMLSREDAHLGRAALCAWSSGVSRCAFERCRETHNANMQELCGAHGLSLEQFHTDGRQRICHVLETASSAADKLHLSLLVAAWRNLARDARLLEALGALITGNTVVQPSATHGSLSPTAADCPTPSRAVAERVAGQHSSSIEPRQPCAQTVVGTSACRAPVCTIAASPSVSDAITRLQQVLCDLRLRPQAQADQVSAFVARVWEEDDLRRVWFLWRSLMLGISEIRNERRRAAQASEVWLCEQTLMQSTVADARCTHRQHVLRATEALRTSQMRLCFSAWHNDSVPKIRSERAFGLGCVCAARAIQRLVLHGFRRSVDAKKQCLRVMPYVVRCVGRSSGRLLCAGFKHWATWSMRRRHVDKVSSSRLVGYESALRALVLRLWAGTSLYRVSTSVLETPMRHQIVRRVLQRGPVCSLVAQGVAESPAALLHEPSVRELALSILISAFPLCQAVWSSWAALVHGRSEVLHEGPGGEVFSIPSDAQALVPSAGASAHRSDAVMTAIDAGIERDLANIMALLFQLWSSGAARQIAMREAEDYSFHTQFSAQRVVCSANRAHGLAFAGVILRLWQRAAQWPARRDVANGRSEIRRRANCTYWSDIPGLGCAFSEATAAEKLICSTAIGSDVFQTTRRPIRTEVSFRGVVAAILRGHFLMTARVFVFWHVWTLLWVPPAREVSAERCAESAGRATIRGGCYSASARQLALESNDGGSGETSGSCAFTVSKSISGDPPRSGTCDRCGAGSPRTARTEASGGGRRAGGTRCVGGHANLPLPPPLPQSIEGFGCSSSLPASAGPVPMRCGRSHVQVSSPSHSPDTSRLSPRTPSTVATARDMGRQKCSSMGFVGGKCGRSGTSRADRLSSRATPEGSTDALSALRAETSMLRVENVAIAERHWTLCAEVRNASDAAREHLRTAARASALGNEKLSLDQAAEIGRWVLDVTDRLRSLTTFVQEHDLALQRSGYMTRDVCARPTVP